MPGLLSLLNLLKWPEKRTEIPRLIPEAAATGYANSFDGTPIFWERHGPSPQETNARPMLFCYGLVCSANQWRAQLARYSEKHPCILFDYRGHHRSGNPTDRALINISACAKDAACVLQELQIGTPVHIWGHSMGCNVALELALAHPEHCQTLVMCCGTAENPFHNMLGLDFLENILTPALQAIQENPRIPHLLWDLLRQRPGWTQTIAGLAGFNTDTSTREDIEAYAQAVCAVNAETFFTLLHELSHGMTRAILPKVKTPSILIAGALDRVTPPIEQRHMAEQMPDATYVEIPAGSHNVQLDFGEYVCLKVESIWRDRELM